MQPHPNHQHHRRATTTTNTAATSTTTRDTNTQPCIGVEKAKPQRGNRRNNCNGGSAEGKNVTYNTMHGGAAHGTTHTTSHSNACTVGGAQMDRWIMHSRRVRTMLTCAQISVYARCTDGLPGYGTGRLRARRASSDLQKGCCWPQVAWAGRGKQARWEGHTGKRAVRKALQEG